MLTKTAITPLLIGLCEEFFQLHTSRPWNVSYLQIISPAANGLNAVCKTDLYSETDRQQ